jgi:prevent-host-death family protein
MKPRIVTIHEAKTNLSQLLRRASNGEEIIISRRSKPVARFVPVDERKGKREPGSVKGRLSIIPEFFKPLPEDELSSWD